MELHPLEVELINRIRERYIFGNISLVCKNGLPFAISETVVSDTKDLSSNLDLLEKIKKTYQWGQITIECKNGNVSRIEKTTTYDVLGSKKLSTP